MNLDARRALTFNAGSSTLRFALFENGALPHAIWRGKISRIGTAEATWSVDHPAGGTRDEHSVPGSGLASAIRYLLDWLERTSAFRAVRIVAHRVVHGMARTSPERVTARLLHELNRMVALDPEHLPAGIALISSIEERFPALLQVAGYDTDFHRGMPQVARRLPIPRRHHAAGVQRYGFHGLSYAFLMEELARLGDPAATRGRVILAHLGSGASLAAVRNGQGIDTSMGFTPASGLMMGTRSGDLDPGLHYFLEQSGNMSATQFHQMVNEASGLLGVSETSNDMRDLLAIEHCDGRAAEAVALFCYHAKKWLGAFAAALGGLDTLVFAGGIGENSPAVRQRICAGMGFLGIELDPAANLQSAAVISSGNSKVAVRVIRTDEELMLARLAFSFCDEQARSPRVSRP